jgi:hypothetical protein
VLNEARISLQVFIRADGMGGGMKLADPASPALRLLTVKAAIAFATNSDAFIYELVSQGTNDPDSSVQAEVVKYLERRRDSMETTAKRSQE